MGCVVTTYYKVLGEGGEAINGGRGKWYLPSGSRPGKWMPTVPVVPCRSGYHVCRIDQLIHWLLDVGRVWVAEVAGEVVDTGDKVVAERARLIAPTVIDTRVMQLLASDFAAHVHRHFDRERPGDRRVADAIRVRRLWADGQVDAAASIAAAATAAAWSAATTSAWSAEHAWQTRLVRDVIAGRRQAGRVRITMHKHEEAS